MSAQDIFYLIGIVFFTIYTILMLGILILVILAIKKVNEILNTIKQKVENTASSITRPENIANLLGKTAANLILFKLFKR